MKKKLSFLVLAALSTTTLTGCTFFDLLSIVTSEESSIPVASIDGDGAKDKQELNYTIKDLVDHSYYSISITPTVGNPKLLVLPIAFSDSSDFITSQDRTTISSQLQKAVFGTKAETGWHSVASYYKEESYNKCVITGEVAPWYQSKMRYNDVTDSKKTVSLVESAVDYWKSNNPDKIKDFDSDNDGYLDGVIAVYGGPNYGADDLHGHPENSNMWAYTSWTSKSKNTANPNVKNFIWASYDFMQADVSNVNIDTHTYIHETGHLFGLDDYYDYNNGDRRRGVTQCNWAGGFSMQDYNVGGHDPYSKLLFGWVNPYIPTTSSTITIKPFESSGDLVLITPEYSASPFDEYILLEYYTPTGVNELDANHSYKGNYPSEVTDRGIRIWHVDSRLLDLTNATKSGDVYTNYQITTDFVNGHSYAVGPTNTTYSRKQGANNDYCSLVQELRQFRLLDLVRRNDMFGTERGSILENKHLFKQGDSFNIQNYSAYFKENRVSLIQTYNSFNNGKTLNWDIQITSITNEEATITIVDNNAQSNNNDTSNNE